MSLESDIDLASQAAGEALRKRWPFGSVMDRVARTAVMAAVPYLRNDALIQVLENSVEQEKLLADELAETLRSLESPEGDVVLTKWEDRRNS